ncbi:MAG: hypothetical protein AAF847_14655 [Bacteroidota bacterium]
MTVTRSFSNIQIELLKLYANNVPDEQLLEIKMLLGKYFAEKATALMDIFIEENNISPEDQTNWTYEHNRRKDRP